MSGRAEGTGSTDGGGQGSPPAATIRAWEDDPGSGGQPIDRPIPDPSSAPLSIRITGPAVPPGVYQPGTAEFRYWTASEALRRGAELWSGLLPMGTNWQPGGTLPIRLDDGEDLNAYYDRTGLSFFHQDVAGTTVYSGESPDVACHELGHAVLDALRPQLWDAASVEAAALHESFGDMSALLCALQLPSVRDAVLTETSGRLYSTSRLSRLAEQLGWALRQFRPELVEADCLRNAVNSFIYQSPNQLPPSGPSCVLSSEPHSFSRVFTAAFLECLAKMLSTRGDTPTAQDLLEVSIDGGRLLIAAIAAAPVVPDYYSQVAAHLVQADTDLFEGRYRDGLKSALVRHGLLSLESASGTGGLGGAMQPLGVADGGAVTGGGAELPTVSLEGGSLGLGNRRLAVEAPAQERRFQVSAASIDLGSVAPVSSADAARGFAEELFKRGRVEFDDQGDPETRIAHPGVRKTHVLRERDGELALVRTSFDCGFD